MRARGVAREVEKKNEIGNERAECTMRGARGMGALICIGIFARTIGARTRPPASRAFAYLTNPATTTTTTTRRRSSATGHTAAARCLSCFIHTSLSLSASARHTYTRAWNYIRKSDRERERERERERGEGGALDISPSKRHSCALARSHTQAIVPN